MKFKRIIIMLMSLLCFVGIGFTLSKHQSQKADQILSNNGLSSQYYIFNTKKKSSIKSLLAFMDKNDNNSQVQIQFESKFNDDKILIWSNYNLRNQPMSKGNSRYFSKSDFDGEIPLAVISTLDNKNIVTFQNNHYIKEGNRYYSVIGRLKANTEKNNENEHGAYYLTTGIYQETANNRLNNYNIVVDGLNKRKISLLKKHLNAQVKVINYSKTYNNDHGINPSKKFIFAVFCIIIALVDSAICAILSADAMKRKFIKKEISLHLLSSQMFKTMMVNLILVAVCFLTLPLILFFTNTSQLLIIYILVYLLQCLTYFMIILRSIYKEK